MKKILFILMVSVAMLSCNDTLLDTQPYDSIGQNYMWTSESLADQGIAGIYGVFYNPDLSRVSAIGMDGFNKYGMEGMGFPTAYTSTINILTSEAKSAGDTYISKEWKFCYEGVHRANDAITNLHRAGLSEEKYGRLMAEAKFMRAFFYYRLNALFQGVPIYLEPIDNSECTKGASTANDVWQVCIDDLTDCINEPNLPNNTLTGLYGRPSKGAAYALRGMVYMWKKEYSKAAADLSQVEKCGYKLWQGEYIDFFKYENERDAEMIFSIQYDEAAGYCDNIQKAIGGRDHYDCWTEVQPSADFVDYYKNADGSDFKWSDYIPEWDELSVAQREVFFLRDNLVSSTDNNIKTAYTSAVSRLGADIMDKYYLDQGNEARIKAAYENRDPRLQQTVFTPYSTADCYSPYFNSGNEMPGKTLRWPYVDRDAPWWDMWSDKRSSAYYMYRKYNETKKGRLIERHRCHTDFPLIRFTHVLLLYAEALNEIGDLQNAINIVNRIRSRAHMPLLNDGTPANAVSGKDDMREKIRYESRVELCVEGVNYFEEVRWGTYKESKFQGKDINGFKNWWGDIVNGRWYYKDYMYPWPVPTTETQMNPNLSPTPGWLY